MENKYYTPSIEEFHVGFEFEINSASGEDIWLPCMLYTLTDSLFNVIYEPDGVIKTVTIPDCIRVKYLNKEDIESLGFALVKDYTFGQCYQSIINDDEKTKDWYELNIEDKNNMTKLSITKWITDDIGGCEQTLFEGTIKNRSEMKVLLKQLNIQYKII